MDKFDIELRKIVNEAKNDKDILAVALFGSFMKGDSFGDIDICLILREKIVSMKASKKRIKFLGKFNDKFDINIFQQLPIYVRIRVIKEGKILFCRDENKLYEVAFDTLKEFDSYKKIYEMYLNEVKNGPRKNLV